MSITAVEDLEGKLHKLHADGTLRDQRGSRGSRLVSMGSKRVSWGRKRASWGYRRASSRRNWLDSRTRNLNSRRKRLGTLESWLTRRIKLGSSGSQLGSRRSRLTHFRRGNK